MEAQRRAFYEYHASMMEPWDGPAAITFTDGKKIGATLDRNGLRPARYFVLDDDTVVLASEAGTLAVDDKKVVEKWRLQPGKMLLIDLEKGTIVSDEEIKTELPQKHPYNDWLQETQIVLEDLKGNRSSPRKYTGDDLMNGQKAFGYTQEDIKILMTPMATTGQEALGSMGTDTPIAPLSLKSKLMFSYFKQKFAQVTNPPIDPIREEMVMSINNYIGPRPNVLDLEHKKKLKYIKLDTPILDEVNANRILSLKKSNDSFLSTKVIDITYNLNKGSLDSCLEKVCLESEKSINEGYNIIVLSDKLISKNNIPISSLLATSKVHQHLIEKGLRTSVGLIIETGEAREIHHFCCLAGYGADAIYPWLALDVVGDLLGGLDERSAKENYIKAIGKGIKKVMSKMGICTYQSYCGA